MIVEILVPQGQGEDALRHQGRHIVLDAPGITIIDKSTGNAFCDMEEPVDLPQQQRATVRCHAAAVETGHNPTPSEAFKLQLSCCAVCRHGGGLLCVCKWLESFTYNTESIPMTKLG